MNLESLAAFRGEAWARRLLRGTQPGRSPSERPWPGKITEARRLAEKFGRPSLVEELAKIIQHHASATWSLPTKS
jgi:hypothetical protein